MICSHHLLKESFYSRNISFCRKHELDCVAFFIESPIKILPLFTNFNISLVDAVRGARELQVRTNSFIDLGRISLAPPENCRVVYSQTALTHHLFQVAVRELILAIPSDAQKDDRWLKVTPLERGLGLIQGDNSRRGDG